MQLSDMGTFKMEVYLIGKYIIYVAVRVQSTSVMVERVIPV